MNIWGSDPDSIILEPSITRKELKIKKFVLLMHQKMNEVP